MSNDNPKVKILVSYHKPSVLLKDEVLTPIHVGRALATESSKDGNISGKDYQWMLDNMIGDDTGDNISNLNREFCELTAVYWAWKNYDKLENPDYIGFMHYRRHLNFNLDKVYDENKWRQIYNKFIDDDYTEKYHLKAQYIKDVVKNYDLLTVKKMLVTIYGDQNNYEQFKRTSNITFKDYDTALKILENKYPEYKDDIDNFNNSTETYYTNIFIMKKELFFQYSKIIFDVLFELKNNIVMYNYSIPEKRIIGEVAERLFSIYLYNLYRTSNYHIIELQRTMVGNTDIFIELKPKYKNSISICLYSNNNSISYLSVLINSIIKTSNSNSYYEIYIIDDDISSTNKEKILYMSKDNIYINFINIKLYTKDFLKHRKEFEDIKDIYKYYVFFIADIFRNFDKVIYLDINTLICKDISMLYNYSNDKMIYACQDLNIIKNLFSERKLSGNWNDYIFNYLNIENIDNYFQSNVILFDIKKCIKFNLLIKCLNKLKELTNIKNCFQDILNVVCQNNTYILDLSWNLQYSFLYEKDIIKKLPSNIYSQYISASKNINILNYNSNDKPWNNINLEQSYMWWEHARSTPFYENILLNNVKIQNNIYTNNYYTKDRFSIGDFIFSILNEKTYIYITILGIKITLKKQTLSDDSNYFNKKLDKLFSIYENKKRTRVTIFGIKIFHKIK